MSPGRRYFSMLLARRQSLQFYNEFIKWWASLWMVDLNIKEALRYCVDFILRYCLAMWAWNAFARRKKLNFKLHQEMAALHSTMTRSLQIVQITKWISDCADGKVVFRLHILCSVQWRQIVQITKWISDCTDCADCAVEADCALCSGGRLCRSQSGFQIVQITKWISNCADGKVVSRLCRSQIWFQIVQMAKWFSDCTDCTDCAVEADCADRRVDFRLRRLCSVQWGQIVQIKRGFQIVQMAEWFVDCKLQILTTGCEVHKQ